MRNLLKHILIHLGLSSILCLFLLYSQFGIEIPWKTLIRPFTGMVVLSVIYSLMYVPMVRQIERYVDWQTYPGWRLFTGLILSYLLAGVIAGSGVMMYFQLTYPSINLQISINNYQEILLKLFILLFVFTSIYELIVLSISAFRHYHYQQLRKVEIEQEHIHTQFEILRTQLNPHFLFNCLNTVSALVYQAPQEAEKFVRDFAKLNQRILATQQEQLVTLDTELKLAHVYLSLMQQRYGQALKFEIKVDEIQLNYFIPPLSIQILLENAIKHNAITTEAPLEIRINTSEADQLMVQNNKRPLLKKPTSFAMGLELLKKRYSFFTAQKPEISDGKDFIVKIPLLKSRSHVNML